MIQEIEFEIKKVLSPKRVIQISAENALAIAREFNWEIFFFGKEMFLKPKKGSAMREGTWINEKGDVVTYPENDMVDEEQVLERFGIYTNDLFPNMIAFPSDKKDVVYILEDSGKIHRRYTNVPVEQPASDVDTFLVKYVSPLSLK